MLACILLGLPLAGNVGATTPLPLGTGTACVMMSEAETRAQLGVKRRHAIVCADPSGMVTRVLVGRKGTVTCSDTVRVRASGRDMVGAPCAGIRAHDLTEAPGVVNLSGTWSVPPCSAIVVEQSGASISISSDCGIYGTLQGSGQIDFDADTFRSSGSATLAGTSCSRAGMNGSVSEDGQSIEGSIYCDQYSFTFIGTRVP